jgi:hypothetical protein
MQLQNHYRPPSREVGEKSHLEVGAPVSGVSGGGERVSARVGNRCQSLETSGSIPARAKICG